MPNRSISFLPTEADYKLIKKNTSKAKAERADRFKRNHDEILRNAGEEHAKCASFAESLKISEDVLKGWQAQENKIIAEMLRWTPTKDAQTIPWHNPTRSPPFQFPFSDLKCFGATGCSLVGPNPMLGQIGAMTVCDAVGAPSLTLASSICSVGTQFVAMASGTLVVDVAARLFGEGHIGCFFSGFAEAVGGVRVYIEKVFPTFEVFEGPLNTFFAETSSFALFRRSGLRFRSIGVSHRIPAEAGAVYNIWVDCAQHATQTLFAAAGLNTDVRVDAIDILLH